MPALYQSEKWLKLQYVTNKKSAKQIADECNATEMTITRYLHKYNLMKRPRTWQRS